jgi:uncharacterized YccA/Bax inhibitor family protein
MLRSEVFNAPRVIGEAGPMTVGGTVHKSFILLAIAGAAAYFTWTRVGGLSMPLYIFGAIGGFIVAMVLSFKNTWAPVLAPVYAALEGLFLGGISASYAHAYGGIVGQAVMLTFGVFFALLAAYTTGLVRPSEKFKMGLIAATGGIALVYLLSMVLSIFGIHLPFIYGSGAFSIGFSVVVVIIAALNLVLDFDFIEQGAAARAPKYMEWYAAFGLLVTLVWLYLEILRLLSKMRQR